MSEIDFTNPSTRRYYASKQSSAINKKHFSEGRTAFLDSKPPQPVAPAPLDPMDQSTNKYYEAGYSNKGQSATPPPQVFTIKEGAAIETTLASVSTGLNAGHTSFIVDIAVPSLLDRFWTELYGSTLRGEIANEQLSAVQVLVEGVRVEIPSPIVPEQPPVIEGLPPIDPNSVPMAAVDKELAELSEANIRAIIDAKDPEEKMEELGITDGEDLVADTIDADEPETPAVEVIEDEPETVAEAEAEAELVDDEPDTETADAAVADDE